MRKNLFLLASLVFFCSAAFSQGFVIESAIINLKEGNLELAKGHIDNAAKHSSTSNSPKMWKVRGDVYYAIATDSNYVALDREAAAVSLQSYINCVKVERGERKKPYTEEAIAGMANACAASYYRAAYYYEAEDYNKSLEYWELMLTAYETDTTNSIEKQLSIPKNDLVQNCANIALKAGNKTLAKKYLQRMIEDPRYLSANAYLQMSFMQLEDGDTAAALATIEKGREKLPDDKNLFNQELSIYTQRGQIEILLNKLSEVIQSDPNNITYLFYRGAIVNDKAVTAMEKAPQYTDSASDARSKMKRAAKPADKNKYKAQMEMFEKKRDSVYAESNKLYAAAEKDYLDALLIDPNYFDALYNIGAMYFNKNKELIDKYNYIETSEPGAAKRLEELEKQMKEGYNKALEYLLKAHEVNSEDTDVWLSLQQTYAQLGNKEESERFRKMRMGE